MRYFLAFALFLFLASPFDADGAVRSLSQGLSGADVTALQNALISKGYLASGNATGYFGQKTETALKKFQCDKKITCSGTVADGYGTYGPRTQAALPSSSSIPTASSKKFEFSGWIPYWKTASGTADVLPHLSQLTSVMPFGYTMHEDGTLADTAKLTEEPWVSFIAEAKKNNVRVIPSVMWGDGDSIHRILSNTNTRIALEDEIAKVVKDNNFDGIDIDFEAKNHETIDYFSTFLKGLYARMGNKWVYCTVEARMPLDHRFSPGAIIPPDATDRANDYVEMNKYCDRIEIMAYDQGTIDIKLNAVRPAPYAPVADPEWAEALVSTAIGSISKNKIILGIPTYGYEYLAWRQPDGKYQLERIAAFNPDYALDIAKKFGITPMRTGAGELGFLYNSVTATSTLEIPLDYLTWSDAQAIADKVALAKKLGLRGVAVFKFDGALDPLMWDVLK